jgi:hypothetical protein
LFLIHLNARDINEKLKIRGDQRPPFVSEAAGARRRSAPVAAEYVSGNRNDPSPFGGIRKVPAAYPPNIDAATGSIKIC